MGKQNSDNRRKPEPWLYTEQFLRPYATTRNHRSTRSHYRRYLRLLADWVQEEEQRGYDPDEPRPLDPAQLTTETIRDYCDWLAEARSWSTTRTYMTGILSYLSHLEAEGLLPDAVSVSRLRAYVRQRGQRENVRPSRRVLSLDDLRMRHVPEMVRYYDTLPLPHRGQCDYNERLSLLRNRAIMHVLYATAMRIFELAQLNRDDVRPGVSYVVITGKRHKQRPIHLRDYVHEAVQAYLAERHDRNVALFVSHSRNSNGQRLSANTIGIVAKKAARGVGADLLSAHDIRHFRAIQLLRRGVPLEVVQEFLGHESISTTRDVYATTVGIQVVREWLDRADDRTLEEAARRHEEEWREWGTAEPLPEVDFSS
jgi:site-specific recombinase XerD